MNKQRVGIVAVVVAATIVAVFALLVSRMATRGRTPSSDIQSLGAGALRGANVLLVTIDTLRADRVGAYGSAAGLTPTLDRLAREGLRFERTYSHVPLTLPSHASLMTADYPTATGVRDNGTFHLDPAHATLATRLKAGGYRTGAFVGAFVLDARFGLNSGFDVYDDRMLGSGADLEVVQRSAEQVLAPAFQWIVESGGGTAPASGGRPWFAWIHLYDPHEPYTPPEPFRSRYSAEPYDGEVAYADAALGSFLDRLRAAASLARTLVVVVSDHGESLGEHGERTHGLFAYDATLRVPLIMWAPEHIQPGVFRQSMRLVDVVPTIVDLIGMTAMDRVDGRSVRPFVAGEQPYDDRGSYFEALNANLTRHWAPLTGIVWGPFKLVDLPIPELYDLQSDPAEQKNVYASQRTQAHDLELRLDRITGAASPIATPDGVDADTEARLRSLGYVGASHAAKPTGTYTSADDPKRLAHLNAALDDAAAMWSRGDSAGAVATLQAVIAERPDLTVAYDRLAFILRATGRASDAAALLDRAARAGHGDRSLLRLLGETLRGTGEVARSAAVLEALVRGDASDLQSADALGQTYARMGRGPLAEGMFKRVLTASPNAAATWNNLGALYLAERRTGEAIDALTRAITINPDLATAHNGLGVAYAAAGDTARAAAEWRKALALRPGYPDAQFNLERLRQ